MGGAATACFTMGTAFMSQALALMCCGVGDGPGSPPATFAAGGGLVAAVGAERGWLAVFLLGRSCSAAARHRTCCSTPPPTSPNRSTAAQR